MNKEKPFSKTLLLVLASLEESGVEFGKLVSAVSSRYGTAYSKGGRSYVAELKNQQYEQIIKVTIRHLKYNSYIKAEKIGKRLFVTLTKKGRAATFTQKLRSAKLMSKGWYIVVIFDIPVSQNWARQQLRQLLKEGGFFLLQQSVWASRADVYDEVINFIKQAKLEQWINVYRATDFLHLPKISKT